MQIGKELKKLRLELGLSQTEMVGDILTKSYYSKIERGLHEINAKDLIEILERNRVNISGDRIILCVRMNSSLK